MATFRIKGLKELQTRMVQAPAKLQMIASGEIEDGMKQWVGRAKADAPVDVAFLKNSISYEKIGAALFQIVAQRFYAPFMEFGTKGNYTPIPGTEEIAAEFKGLSKPGKLFDFILEWVIRKGIGGDKPDEVAFLIARSIFKHGVKAHPFFFKQGEIVFPEIIARLQKKYEEELKVKVINLGTGRPPKYGTI